MSTIRFTVGQPAYRNWVHTHQVEAFLNVYVICGQSQAAAAARRQGVKPGMALIGEPPAMQLVARLVEDGCSIAWNSDDILWKSLDPKLRCDWCLLVDADTFQLNPVPIMEMLVTGHARNAAMIGAPVKRRDGLGYNVLIKQEGQWLLPNREELAGKVLEVDRIGSAFVAVNLGWLRRHWESWPFFDTVREPTPLGTRPKILHHDWATCDKVRAKGGIIIADGRFEPVHAESQPLQEQKSTVELKDPRVRALVDEARDAGMVP